jgi:polysaccharide pyruvyl transferase WcaK-like protein
MNKMARFVFPRVTKGNRGDIASRWGLLHGLQRVGVQDAIVYYNLPVDIPSKALDSFRYLPLSKGMFNLARDLSRDKTESGVDTVLWAVGLDVQDDSSLSKLIFLWGRFWLYRRIGLNIWMLFQGAGPVTTPFGKWIARHVLDQVNLFVARDPSSYELVGQLNHKVKRVLAHDAIFMPGMETDLLDVSSRETDLVEGIFKDKDGPVIGLNIRLWFHFASDLLPFQLAQKQYLERSSPKMDALVASTSTLVKMLRKEYNAKVVLISAYQPGVVEWEDDQPWLERIKQSFVDDSDVISLNDSLSMPAYYKLMEKFDLVIGMRLHTCLIALRFGTPAINLNYTLKGKDILSHLGLAENIFELDDFIQSPTILSQRIKTVLDNQHGEKLIIDKAVQTAINENMIVLESLAAN